MTATGETVLHSGMDEETKEKHSQEDHRVEPTREVQEREASAHLEAHTNDRVGGETAHVTGSEMHCSKQGQVVGTSGRPMFHQEGRGLSVTY